MIGYSSGLFAEQQVRLRCSGCGHFMDGHLYGKARCEALKCTCDKFTNPDLRSLEETDGRKSEVKATKEFAKARLRAWKLICPNPVTLAEELRHMLGRSPDLLDKVFTYFNLEGEL